MIEYYQKACGSNSKSPKTKNYVTNYARYTTLKKSFLMVYVGMYGCGGSESLSRDFRGQDPLREFLGSKEHLN